MPQGQQCVFCQLIDNPDQLFTVGETENFYAWLEVNPRAKGHTQIVPKEHVENILELGPDRYQEAMGLVRDVMNRAVEGLGADGVSVTMNVKEAAGQMLPHAYISVFPRFTEEENAGTPTGAIFPQREELQSEIEDLQEAMRAVSVERDEEDHEIPDTKNFQEGGRVVDREEMEQEAAEEGGQEEEQGEDVEEEQEETGGEEKEQEEDGEPEGKGSWDGKSFEWR